jgi:hypothetical protein
MRDKKRFLKFRFGGMSLLIIWMLSGCSETGSPGVASGFGGGTEKWTIVVKRFGPGQEQFADIVVNTLVNVRMQRDKIKKVKIGNQTVVMYGGYPSVDDSRAQADMKYIKSLYVQDEGYPFVDAHLEPIPEPDPPVEASWLLSKSGGYWTLQIAQFTETGRKKAAVELAGQLRSKGIPAYVFHGPVKSLVTIGSYPESAVGSAGKQKISRQMKAADPELRKWKREYPYLLINSEYAKFKTKKDGKDIEVRLESQIIRVPRDGELLW